MKARAAPSGRESSKREDMTVAYQALVLKILSPLVIIIYGIRCFLAYHSGHGAAAALLLSLLILFALVSHIPRWTEEYKYLGFASTVAILSGEAWLVLLQNQHYSLFPILIPLAITYCSFMSGIVYGTVASVIALVETIILMLRTGNGTQGDFLDDFFLRLIAVELLIAAVLFIFQHVLDEGERDISAHRALREKTARRAALAEVLGKLAHEVNNPLAILHGAFHRFCRLQTEGRLAPTSEKQLLAYMEEGHSRIQSVLNNLRAFTEGDLVEPMQKIRVQDLFWQIRQTSSERIRSSGTALVIEAIDPQARILGRPQQIFFILSALLDNALDSMQDKAGIAKLRFKAGPEHDRFEVEDEGVGIADEVAERIFQPFVTTKDFGQSMGMNLSICHGLASEHAGHLGFIRKPQGTIFWLELPKPS